MKTYKLYIGANNATGEVELDKIENVLDTYFEGYTIEETRGRWQGRNENSISVLVITDVKTLKKLLLELNTILDQDAIAFHSVAMLQFEGGRA